MVVLQNRFSELLAQKSRRIGRKITLLDASEEMGVSRKTLEAWAKNNVNRFDADIIIRMCQYLNCSVGELLVIEETIDGG
jgi:DNA-binding Xre family transcriptional regulator